MTKPEIFTIPYFFKVRTLATVLTLGLLAIPTLNGCTSRQKRNEDRAAILHKAPEPLQIFKVDSKHSQKASPELYALAKAFATNAKLCSYGIPLYAQKLATEYKESLDPNSPHYLLFQRRTYDRQYRECIALLKFRATPPVVETDDATDTHKPNDDTLNKAQNNVQDNTQNNNLSSNDNKDSSNTVNVSGSNADTSANATTNASTQNSSKDTTKDTSRETTTTASKTPGVVVAVATVNHEPSDLKNKSLNRYSYSEYQQAYDALKDVAVSAPEDILGIIDAFYAQDDHEEAEYWIRYYRLVEYQNRRADVKLGRHLFKNEHTKKIGYGILVNYVRSTGSLARLSLLNRAEFIAYRDEHPELQAQYEQLEKELEDGSK